jgi:lysozyme family protein
MNRVLLGILHRRWPHIFRSPSESERYGIPDIAAPLASHGLIDSMIDALISREGGYVNHPADRGGPTNCGITRETLAAWRKCSVSAEDVKCLKISEAAEIYRTIYYFAPNINKLPLTLQAHIFDIAVNSGPKTGIKLLQRALNKLGSDLREDGVIGPKTLAACSKLNAREINNALVEIRHNFYDAIVSGDRTQKVFAEGWHKRADHFRT